jgi:hypothetical protein
MRARNPDAEARNAQLQRPQLSFEHELAWQQKRASAPALQVAWHEPPSQKMPPPLPVPQAPVPEHVTVVVGAATTTPPEHASVSLHSTCTVPPASTTTFPQESPPLHVIEVDPPAVAVTPLEQDLDPEHTTLQFPASH